MKKVRELLSKTFRPTRGGDGGVVAADVQAITMREARRGLRRAVPVNACVFPTVAPAASCLPTRSKWDRAHSQKIDGKLVSAAVVHDAEPRQYPENEFATPIRQVGVNRDGSPVFAQDRRHFEEVFDATHAIEKWLREQELEVNGKVAVTVERAAEIFGKGFRPFTEQRTHVWR
jgi:hypothetical protein